MPARLPYTGSHKKLVLAFDIGTTFSGISYSVLEPGEIPEIKGVTRFPAQEYVGGDSKIPTIVYYNREGAVCAVGAEALKEGIENIAEDEDWVKAEWFKLHLRPASESSSTVVQKIPPLPENKTVLDVFSDFLRYLYRCASTFIQETHANGVELWNSLKHHTEFVLTHPNGWEGAQQAQMRSAAINAGLIPDTKEARSRVHFVTEGEASLHFCIQSGLTIEALNLGEGILIVDAGGGTIDVSAYGQTSGTTASFQEITAPQCYFHGSIFVTTHARAFLQDLLEDSKFADDVDHITQCFDKTTKLRFRNHTEPQYIRFGTVRDKDVTLGIRSGQLRLDGKDVAKFFEPSVQCIINCIFAQRKRALRPITSVFLVGGFAASDWLFMQIKDALEPIGVVCCRPDSHVNKAVADGGVSFYVDHFVTARVAKHHYGLDSSILYRPNDPEHRSRSARVHTDASGDEMVSPFFTVVLLKDTQVSETTEFHEGFTRTASSINELPDQIWVDILCYRGPRADPRWTDEEPDMYTQLCTITADVRQLKSSARQQLGRNRHYYSMNFDVCIKFGLTEFTAHISWKFKGKTQSSPAEIVYDHDDNNTGSK